MTRAAPLGRSRRARRALPALALVGALLGLGAFAGPAAATSQPLTYTGQIGLPRLVAPEGVAVDGNGDVIVAEPTASGTSTNDRIAKYSADGNFLDVIAGPGTANADFPFQRSVRCNHPYTHLLLPGNRI